jgi:uncharacterized protein (DUF2236 family)
MQDHGYFGKQSMTWKVASEAVVTLGGSRAVLMQIAHPLVAMGVMNHSRYMSDPLGRAERTFMLGQFLAFGSTSAAQRAARTINRLHTHVHGTLPMQAGAYSSGTPFYAQDPTLLLWVHATLIDTILEIYLLFIGPLSHEEQERYYQESKKTARLLGLSANDMPQTVDDLRQYVGQMVHSNHLVATAEARQIARTVLFPPVPGILRPFLHLNCAITCALLPQPIREIYGLEWSKRQARAFKLFARGARAILSRLPGSLRIFPITRKIMENKIAA